MTPDKEIAGCIGRAVDSQQLAGGVGLLWQEDRLRIGWAGFRDIGGGIPMKHDTLFRIASMTKAITTVVALTLFQEGRFALDDPIARWAPEFSEMRVLKTPDAALDETVRARRPVTMEDLLTHRSGLTYGSFHSGPIAHAYASALGGDIDSWVTPNQWIENLATLPLIDQPGRCFHYGHSTDLLGLIMARMEGAPLGEVLSERLLEPLGMLDTHFLVPEEKRPRRASLYGFDDRGDLTARRTGPGGSTVPERPTDMGFVSGGQGLWSTVSDYLAFARLFTDGGEVDGVRLLEPETLALMTTNRLTPAQRTEGRVAGLPLFASGHGYGMGVATVLEPEHAVPTVCGGGQGSVGWPGGFGGFWQADPNNRSVRVFLTHNVVELDQLRAGVGLGVFGVITAFQALSL